MEVMIQVRMIHSAYKETANAANSCNFKIVIMAIQSAMMSHPPFSEQELIHILKSRFDAHPERHTAVKWDEVKERIEQNEAHLAALQAMEATGGEPDVVTIASPSNAIVFIDCSKESPSGRRSLCYDQSALDSRKENKPAGSAMGLAQSMGVSLLTQEDYAHLQQIGQFDLKTSSWLYTPEPIRKLGGAIFGDRRFNTVFTYHNGAESYYAARGFRAKLVV